MTSKKRARGPARRSPSEDDAQLWAALSKTVKPLVHKKRAAVAPPRAPEASAPDTPAGTPKRAAAPPRRPAPVTSATPARPPAPPPLAEGEAPGVDKRTATRLRRGLMTVEATLDLHGLGRETARERLTAFIASHHAAGRRCVLVITGKGLKDDWSPGVIRSAVPQWLNEPPLRPLVLSFATAQPQHGGSGAIYVLLKRAR